MLKSSRLDFLKIKESSIHKFNETRFTYNVMKYITGHALTTEEAIQRYLRYTEDPVFGNYFVIDNSTQKVIGIIKFVEEHPGEIEIGYSLFEEYWGKGYATEMAEAMVAYALEQLKPQKIIGYVDSRNPASQKILEKMGLVRQSQEREKEGNIIYFYSRTIS
ncbi:GNAT family N-acetyltransferase [Emticicia agri]|uniref:N-acetyltransferase n=1 Tax=Emticicia agri TaxID=2492393 RepID=A0A4Q5M4Z6_9BACT|nr:GNAT family N-acetyltransferase [Emticicia agri]RYU97305.1 N-acetyltransferase [Emticicia agri]